MDLSFDELTLDEVCQSVLSTARALVKDRPMSCGRRPRRPADGVGRWAASAPGADQPAVKLGQVH